jgi:hypothetical protein
MTRLAPVVMAAAIAWFGLTADAAAQAGDNPVPVPEDASRYSFYRTGDRFVRLDSHTGQVAECGWHATGWSCNTVPEERAALESEIVRLQRENAALKKTLLSRGLALPGGAPPEASARKDEPPAARAPDAAPRPPSEADLDRALSFVKNVWRRLVELIADLQRDIQRKS